MNRIAGKKFLEHWNRNLVKGKVIPIDAMKAYVGNGGITSLIV